MKIKEPRAIIRFIIQLMFFILLPTAYSAAFAGVRYIFSRMGEAELIEHNTFITVLMVLLIYTIVFGRFFCGYACAFGSLGDWLFALRRKTEKLIGKKTKSIPEKIMGPMSYIKYVNLILIAAFCYMGLYDRAHGTSPWEVFAKVRSLSIDAGEYKIGIIVLSAVIIGMTSTERFFCRVLCPMGAVFAVMPVIPAFSLRRSRSECIKGCRACTNTCPSSIELPKGGSMEVSSDCFACQKCIGRCPGNNIHSGIKRLRGDEIWFTLIRAGVLFGLLTWIGI